MILTGSIAAGLGHEQSDIDVMLITDQPGQVHELNYNRGGRRIDLLPFALKDFRRVIDLTSAFRATRQDRHQVMLDHVTAMRAARVATGELLWADATAQAELDRIDLVALARMLMVRAAIEAATYTEDAVGCMAIGDWYTALDAAQLALRKACDSVLTAGQDFYISDKFLFRRLARLPQAKSVFDDVWSLVQASPSPATDPKACAATVQNRLLLAGYLVGRALLDGWTGDLPDLTYSPPSAEGPRRSPEFSLMRFADAIALAGPNVGFEVSEPTARLWLALNGRPRAAAIADLAQMFGLDAEAGPTIGLAIDAMIGERAVDDLDGMAS
ncbi:nucleotidyltransferase domain-containing protein [Micromonospora sp. NPDC051196]|uniref:nucleotidyltransferase domain-containing protein n=1 Tax=Micromonospora sp. NPDC051196 TaxID=3155281 RepID=UPI00341AFA30